MNRRRVIELAFLLPWVGVFLFTPPMTYIASSWGKASGQPLFVLYVFACWLILIIAGGLVAQRLIWSDARRPGDGEAMPPDGAD